MSNSMSEVSLLRGKRLAHPSETIALSHVYQTAGLGSFCSRASTQAGQALISGDSHAQ